MPKVVNPHPGCQLCHSGHPQGSYRCYDALISFQKEGIDKKLLRLHRSTTIIVTPDVSYVFLAHSKEQLMGDQTMTTNEDLNTG